MTPPIGVVVMAYGGPESLDDVEPYLLDVRGFRPTPVHLVEEVRSRYAAIGGRSPILDHTRTQAAGIAAALDRLASGRYVVTVGMRHWTPYIRTAVAALADTEVERFIGLVMAPHDSRLSVGKYEEALREAAGPASVEMIRTWHLLPGYLEALAQRTEASLGTLPAPGPKAVIFTAHSLPERIRQWHDPYPAELRATVDALAPRLGAVTHRFAYQSAAMTPEPWLGPDVAEVLADLAGEGHDAVAVVPIGFTSEHVEILYDLDVELQARAASLGVTLVRAPMVGAHRAMLGDLAALCDRRAAAAGWR